MLTLSLDALLQYTAWEREKWRAWFTQHGDQVLATSAGPHNDGRFATVGDLIRHIFSGEMRYVDRLMGREVTDTSVIPTNNVEALFRFGEQSRSDLEKLLAEFPAQKWDIPEEMKIGTYSISVTPRKAVVHILIHEIRHWAQIATLLRLSGLKGEFHDFLFSPVFTAPVTPREA